MVKEMAKEKESSDDNNKITEIKLKSQNGIKLNQKEKKKKIITHKTNPDSQFSIAVSVVRAHWAHQRE